LPQSIHSAKSQVRPYAEFWSGKRQRPRRPLPRRVQGNSRPAHRRPAPRRRGVLVRVELKKPYSDRGVRKILARYTQAAGFTASISPHTLRHFLFTWLKTQRIDDALIQPYSGHATRQSMEIYSRLALADAQQRYDDVIGDFPV